jgi:diacylglycerol kinase family enzyme
MNILWRMVAVAALVIYSAVFFLALRIVVRNPLFAVLFFASAGLLLYSVWLICTGVDRRISRGKVYMMVGLLLLIGELIYFLHTVTDVLSVAVFLVMSMAYVVTAGMVRNQYWKAERAAAEASQNTVHFKNPWLIVNPKSGSGRAIKNNIPELARRQGIKVRTLRRDDNVESVARQAADAGADVLGVSGGDGSLGAVAKIAIERGLPVVVLPGGTRCHFARDLGLEPRHIVDSLAGFTGVERRVDVGTINNRIFLNNVSFGLYADIVDNPAYRENKKDVSRQVVREIVSGSKNLYDLRFRHGSQRFNKAVVLFVGVNNYQTMNALELGVRKCLDEGRLQVTAMLQLNDAVYKSMLGTMAFGSLGGQKAMRGVEQWHAQTFHLANGKQTIVAGVDGEREEYPSPVTIRLLPKALSVCVPAEGIRRRPKNAFRPTSVKELWHALSPSRHA